MNNKHSFEEVILYWKSTKDGIKIWKEPILSYPRCTHCGCQAVLQGKKIYFRKNSSLPWEEVEPECDC